ncbi:MAG: GTPase ObgE [Fibrobacteres bacterium]|nr:GTPase ObgE [Fibrobacterota bacterium]
MIDRARIRIVSGNGGAGSVSFRREKYVDKGGPDGGDGGKGGHVIFIGNKNINTLNDLRWRKTFEAENGEHGHGAKCHGKDGKDLVIQVPLGTLIYDENDKQLFDINTDGQREIVAKGGRGGLGNQHFATATRQTPRYAQPGEPGVDMEIKLELKIIADVGLVGEPNAGKSTLLSRVSNAKPKIADYPFTTLTPNLGLVRIDDTFSFVMADIPGLIEGAHEGKGLGHEFLRHVERTRLLLYVIDQSGDNDTAATFKALKKELEAHKKGLSEKPTLVVLNKEDMAEKKPTLKSTKKRTVMSISALTGTGLKELRYKLKEMLSDLRD